MPAHQRVDADRQHRAHHVGRQRFAYAYRVGDDEVVLQFLGQRLVARVGIAAWQFVARTMRAQQLVRVAAEARGDAVDRLAAPHLVGDEIRRALHLCELRRVELDLRTTARDRDHVGTCEMAAVQANRRHARCTSSCANSTRSDFTSSARGTSNWSPRRKSFTATAPRAISSSPATTAKRMPARSAYFSCLPNLPPSSATSVAMPASRSSFAIARHSGKWAASICVTSTCTLLSAVFSNPASRNCQNRRVRPIEMPTPGKVDLV